MNPARRLGSRGGWSWCVPKLLTDHICDKFCNPTSNIHNIYHVSKFPNNIQTTPKLHFYSHPILQALTIYNEVPVYNKLNGLKTGTIVFIGSSKTRPYYTYNHAPLTRNEKYSIQTYDGNRLQLKGKMDRASIHIQYIKRKWIGCSYMKNNMMDRVSIHKE